MTTAGQFCKRNVSVARPSESILPAARRMRDEHVGCLVVVNEDADGNRTPIGVLTDRDIVVHVLAKGDRSASDVTVEEAIRGQHLVFAFGGDDLAVAIDRMREAGVRRLPVIDLRNQLEGLLSFDDLIGVLSADTVRLVSLVAQEQRAERVAQVAS